MKKNLPLLILAFGMLTCPSLSWAQNVTSANITSVSADKQAAAVNVTLTGTLTTNNKGDFRQLRDLCCNMASLNLKSASCSSIPKNALHSRHKLKTLILPDRLSTIGTQAFFACDSLEALTIPANTSNIGASAFAQCKSITTLTIPQNSNLYNIGSYAFEGCESLSGIVNIPSKILVLRDGVFAGCKNLEGISLPDNLQRIGANAFAECEKLSGEINLGRMITHIGASAFADCKSLSQISMPRGLQVLGDAAFMGCDKLSGDIVLPSNTIQIGKGAFMGCSSLESIVIPADVAEIKAATFAGCTGLRTINIYAKEPIPANATAFAGLDCSQIILSVPAGSEEAYKDAPVWKNFNIQVATSIDNAEALCNVSASVEDGHVWIKGLPQASAVKLYNIQGQLLESTLAEGTASFSLQNRGVYIVKVNGSSFKVQY